MLSDARMVRLSIAPATETACGDGTGRFCPWLRALHLGAERFCLIWGGVRDPNGWPQRNAECLSAETEARAEVTELRASLAAAQASAARLLSVARRLAEDERQTKGDE